MKEQFVELETAKLAKEKEFLQDSDGKISYVKTANDSGYTTIYTTIPTQSLLQKWLREKHGLILWVEYTGINDIKWCYHIYGRLGVHIGNSYEECLEAGLQEALNLIVL